MNEHDDPNETPAADLTDGSPRPRRPIPLATGAISSSGERAVAAVGWNNPTEVGKVKAWIDLVDRVETERLDFRQLDYAKERPAIKAAALEVCKPVGLAGDGSIYGHRLRRLLSEMIRRSLGQKKFQSDSFTCTNIEHVLLQRDFQARACDLLRHPGLTWQRWCEIIR